ncbi:MAG: glutathione S-transferase family protein [Cyanobacteriota bacterium]
MGEWSLVIGNKNYSSWSLRAWLPLKQLGQPFQEIRLPLDTPEFAGQIALYSPAGRVPVLRHGSLIIWDSLAIAEYLAETFPTAHLWPINQESRAIARAVSAEMHAGFADLRQALPMDCRARRSDVRISVAVQRDIARILQIWQECRRQYGQGGDYLFGSFTLADAMYAPVVSRFQTYGVKLEGIAAAYAEAVLGIPAVQEWMVAAAAEAETLVTV